MGGTFSERQKRDRPPQFYRPGAPSASGKRRCDNVTAGATWRIGAYVEASMNEAGPWGQDNSDTVLEISVPVSLPGDVNGDGSVNSADLDVVRGNWGQTVPPGDSGQGDLSGDGIVNSADLDIIRANWGAVLSAVPEPSTLFLGLMAVVLLGLRRVC